MSQTHDSFGKAVFDARNAGWTVRDVDHEVRAFLVGPVDMDLISWLSDRDEITTHSRVARDGEQFVSVTVDL